MFAFSEKDEFIFKQEISNASLLSIKAKIDLDQSKCGIQNDLEHVLTAIKAETTLETLKNVVFSTLRSKMLSILDNNGGGDDIAQHVDCNTDRQGQFVYA